MASAAQALARPNLIVRWRPSDAPDVAFYRVKIARDAAGPFETVMEVPASQTEAMFPVEPGTWYAGVTAVDYAGNESPITNQVQVEIR